MGYVLPVAHYQYQDYKRRITPNKQSRFYIDRVYKPALIRTYQGTMLNLTNGYKDIAENKQYTSDRYDDTLNAEITGKGENINIRV